MGKTDQRRTNEKVTKSEVTCIDDNKALIVKYRNYILYHRGEKNCKSICDTSWKMQYCIANICSTLTSTTLPDSDCAVEPHPLCTIDKNCAAGLCMFNDTNNATS